MERHDFIVQEISGDNDHGEDLCVSFTEQGVRTGDTIAVQVKGGSSYKTADGYRVPARSHVDFWLKSNAPVFCVVHDPESGELFWANASSQARDAKRSGRAISSIEVRSSDRLSDDNVATFALRVRLYIAETGDLHKFLTTLSGVTFEPTDYLAYFENIFGERMIFCQKRQESSATLYHSDLDWDQISISVQDIEFYKPAAAFRSGRQCGTTTDASSGRLTLRDVVLSQSERMWIEACFQESQWVRSTDGRRVPQYLVSPHIAPILYSPFQEHEIADRTWRRDGRMDSLMATFIELGYRYHGESPTGTRHESISPKVRDAVWSEMRTVVRRLRSLNVPAYYLMGNRGRLTRSEMQMLLNPG